MKYQLNDNLKHLIAQSLREQEDSYTIQQLFDQFPYKDGASKCYRTTAGYYQRH